MLVGACRISRCLVLTTLLSILAVLNADNAQDAACEVSLQELRVIMEKKEESFAADMIQLQQELETANKQLGLCQATAMASETREEMLHRQIAQLEGESGADQNVMDLQRTVRGLQAELEASKQAAESRAKEAVLERNAMKQTITSLQNDLEMAQDQAGNEFKQRDSLRVELDAQKQSHAAELEIIKGQIAQLQEKLRASESEKSKLQKATADTTDELLEARNSVEKANNELQILKKQHQSEMAAWQKSENELQEQLKAARADVAKNIQGQIDEAVQKATEKSARRIQKLMEQKQEISAANQQLLQEAKSAKAQLQAVKNELFTVRRELFDLNEKLREPELRRKLMLKRLREVADYAKEFVEKGIESVRPHYEEHVQPVLTKLQPYCNSAIAFSFDQFEKIKAHHVPVIKEKLGEMYEAASVRVSFELRRLQQVAKPCTEKLGEMYEGASVGASLKLRRLRQLAKPHTDKFMNATEEPRLILREYYDEYLKAHVQKLHHVHADVKHSIANGLLEATELLLDYFKVQNVSPNHSVVKMTEALHAHAAQVVHYAEACLVIIIGYLVLMRRRRRKQIPKRKIKID